MISSASPTLDVKKSDLCLPFEFCQGSDSRAQHFLVILDNLRHLRNIFELPQTDLLCSDKMSLTVSTLWALLQA